jgi:ferritin-like metal-binding protein YciE
MGIFTPDIHNLRELYKIMLEKTLNSERQIVQDGLPEMIKGSTNVELQNAFQQHLEESKTHVSRIERILDDVEGEENESKCKVTAALISEASSAAGDTEDNQLRDVVLIAAGNQVEHHEIAVYGTLRTWAEILGENEHAALLEKTLEEEKNANETLIRLSKLVNVEAPVA